MNSQTELLPFSNLSPRLNQSAEFSIRQKYMNNLRLLKPSIKLPVDPPSLSEASMFFIESKKSIFLSIKKTLKIYDKTKEQKGPVKRNSIHKEQNLFCYGLFHITSISLLKTTEIL